MSRASGFLPWAFRPGARLSAPVRYRFEVTGAVPSRVDIVVAGDHASITEAGDTAASVTLHCDTETYVLVMYGRLSLEAARAVGRLRVEGDQVLVGAFGQWFKGA
jgi:putative sterol carrier protein